MYIVGGIGIICGFVYGVVGFKVIYINNSGFFVFLSNDVIGGNVIVFVSIELIILILFIVDKF